MAASDTYYPLGCRNTPGGLCSQKKKCPMASADPETLCKGGSQCPGTCEVLAVANNNRVKLLWGCSSGAVVISWPIFLCAGHRKETAGLFWGEHTDARGSVPEAQKRASVQVQFSPHTAWETVTSPFSCLGLR